MNEIILNLAFLIFVLTTVNITYKRKIIDKTGWKKVIALSLWFVIWGIIILIKNYQNLPITANSQTLGFFATTTLVWFIFPWLIRRFGTYPSYYFKDKKGNTRFMVKFEYPSMIVKYFEVLFQQTTFLFLLFVVLIDLTEANRIFLFTVIIAIIHLGNLLFMDYKWALFYTALSIPMAVLFGYLILRGFILITAGIHLAFYLIFNARYWFVKK